LMAVFLTRLQLFQQWFWYFVTIFIIETRKTFIKLKIASFSGCYLGVQTDSFEGLYQRCFTTYNNSKAIVTRQVACVS
jgi:hypothetical protein